MIPTAPPNKHALRTRETRQLLLSAAETVFVRDGYDGAELGEIAKLAGRTKGAIYAHFKSKEDIFLALVETEALRRRAHMQQIMSATQDTRRNLAAMRKYFLSSIPNDTWVLLLLEFRLFALRHPESQVRLKKTYAAIVPTDQEARYTELLGPAPKTKAAISRTSAVHSMFAVLSALQLERRFLHQGLVPGDVEKLAASIFDVLFAVPSK